MNEEKRNNNVNKPAKSEPSKAPTRKSGKDPAGVRVVRGIAKGLLSCLLVTGIAAIAFVSWSVIGLMKKANDFDITLYKTDMASTVYVMDENGKYVQQGELYSDYRREWVGIDRIPIHVQKAVVAIEDERFYAHKGVDIKRTAGALGGYLTGNMGYGGSTITQQLIKNITGENDTTAERKAEEIFRALVLETKMEKEEILEYYLNIVYFANNSYGIQTAARTYFDKEAAELTLAEGAAIVGITQNPSRFNPYTNPENNKEKQELVLGKMLQLNFITQEEYDTAMNEQLEFKEKTDSSGKSSAGEIATFFNEAMVKQVTADLADELDIPVEQAEQLVYTGGLQIYSTMDVKVQESIDDVFCEPTRLKEEAERDGKTPEKSKYFPVVTSGKDKDDQPQAAIVVISPEDGSVKGMYGQVGRKSANLVLNRATDTKRQPGSTMKPIAVYGPAIELGLAEPDTPIVDEPYSIPEKNWYPHNWYSGYKGTITLQEAVAQSMNIPAIKTLQRVGVDNSYDFVKNKLGLSLHAADKDIAPLSLGGLTEGVSVLEMTAAYNAFASGGVYTEPYFYTKVVDRNGKVILEKNPESRRVFSTSTAKKMTGVLKVTAEGSLGFGSARFSYGGKALPNHQSAGKTGSTNDDKDKWYIGFTTYYTAGVWYGHDQPRKLNYSETALTPHKIWQGVMLGAHENLPATKFEGIDYRMTPITKYFLCKTSGGIANEACPEEERKEVLKEETEGKEPCTVHTVQESVIAPGEDGTSPDATDPGRTDETPETDENDEEESVDSGETEAEDSATSR